MTAIGLRYLTQDDTEVSHEQAHHIVLTSDGQDLVRIDPDGDGSRWVVTEVYMPPLSGLMGPDGVSGYASPSEAQSHLADIEEQRRCTCGRTLVDTACPHCDIGDDIEMDAPTIRAEAVHIGDVLIIDESEHEVTSRSAVHDDSITLELDSCDLYTLKRDQLVTLGD